MSEIDSLSASGTYPALPLAAKRRTRRDANEPQTPDSEERKESAPQDGQTNGTSKHLIDEYV